MDTFRRFGSVASALSGALLLLVAISDSAHAAPRIIPELDPASIYGAVALLAGSVLLFKDSNNRR